MINIKKTGQISIFVILSIIIVISSITTYIFFSEDINLFEDTKKSNNVKQYVEKCLESQTNMAQELIGSYGGWLYGPKRSFSDKNKPESFNKGMQGISLFEEIDLPYWVYFDDTQNKFKTQIPTYDEAEDKYSIKNQIQTYLIENIEKNCIRNFDSFNPQYKITKEKISLDVDMADDVIVVKMQYPLSLIEKGTNNTFYLDSFLVEVPNKIIVPYVIAKDLVNSEIETSFIEHKMLSIFTAYQSTNNRKNLPPFYELKTNVYDSKPWILKDTKKRISQILNSNIKLLKFDNTYQNDVSFLPDDLKDNEFAKGIEKSFKGDYLNLNTKNENDDKNKEIYAKYKDYEISPNYEMFYPNSISFTGSSNQLILFPEPKNIAFIFPFFTTTYKSNYDMTFPIVFDIKNREDKNSITFKVAVETNIKNNLVLQDAIGLFGNKVLDTNFESYTGGSPTLICDEELFNSGNYILEITDPTTSYKNKNYFEKNFEGIDEAQVTFNCKGIETCFIVQTEKDTKSKTKLNFSLPLDCTPGALEIYKFNHKKLVFNGLNPQQGKNVNLGISQMPSLKEFNTIVNIGDNRRKIKETEQVFIIFENTQDTTLTQVIEIDKTNIADLIKVDLLPNTNYSIKGFVMDTNKVTIPQEEKCYDKNLFDEECQTLPKIELDTWIVGGIEINDFNFEISKLKYNNLNIDLVYIAPPNSYNTLEQSSEKLNNINLNSEEPYIN